MRTNQHISPELKLQFIPSMYFFVMGFRDSLKYLEDTSSNNELQRMINEHCKEDSEHWRWYLQDLQWLQEHKVISDEDLKVNQNKVWSDEWFLVRNTTYDIIHSIKSNPSILNRMAVLQVLESTFDAFNSSVSPCIQQMDKWEDLYYFGKMHVDSEEGHSSHEWDYDDLEKVASLYHGFGEEECEAVEENVVRLFNRFNEMFEVWNKCNVSFIMN
ncbi:hypothetical protein V6R21_19400 [Limibacter armeniacum]|uniref:hypothetical protein n=1 Tax=Limibacter armeniacum TaxID=466084 RepID=UPI002FE58E49